MAACDAAVYPIVDEIIHYRRIRLIGAISQVVRLFGRHLAPDAAYDPARRGLEQAGRRKSM